MAHDIIAKRADTPIYPPHTGDMMSADTTKPPPGDTPPFSPQDAMAFMQKMWNPFGIPIPGFGTPPDPNAGSAGGMPFPSPAAMFAALDPAEVGRKINELQVIESWLAMSLSMTQMSIKTLELQKASLEAMRAAHKPKPESTPRNKG
jgi:hypothetical protein